MSFEILADLKREGVEISLPQRDLHLRSVTESASGSETAIRTLGDDRESGGSAIGKEPSTLAVRRPDQHSREQGDPDAADDSPYSAGSLRTGPIAVNPRNHGRLLAVYR